MFELYEAFICKVSAIIFLSLKFNFALSTKNFLLRLFDSPSEISWYLFHYQLSSWLMSHPCRGFCRLFTIYLWKGGVRSKNFDLSLTLIIHSSKKFPNLFYVLSMNHKFYSNAIMNENRNYLNREYFCLILD